MTSAVVLARLDEPVHVLQAGGEGLLAEYPLHARLGGLDAQIGMGIVGCGYAEDVQVGLSQHRAEVGVVAHVGPSLPPGPFELIEQFGHEVAHGDDVEPVGDRQARSVAMAYRAAERRRRLHCTVRSDSSQADQANSVCPVTHGSSTLLGLHPGHLYSSPLPIFNPAVPG